MHCDPVRCRIEITWSRKLRRTGAPNPSWHHPFLALWRNLRTQYLSHALDRSPMVAWLKRHIPPVCIKLTTATKTLWFNFTLQKNKTKKTDYFDRGARDTSAVLCRNKAYGTRSRTLRTRLPASLIQPSRTYSDYTWWALKMFGRETGATSALVADWLDRERLKICWEVRGIMAMLDPRREKEKGENVSSRAEFCQREILCEISK